VLSTDRQAGSARLRINHLQSPSPEPSGFDLDDYLTNDQSNSAARLVSCARESMNISGPFSPLAASSSFWLDKAGSASCVIARTKNCSRHIHTTSGTGHYRHRAKYCVSIWSRRRQSDTRPIDPGRLSVPFSGGCLLGDAHQKRRRSAVCPIAPLSEILRQYLVAQAPIRHAAGYLPARNRTISRLAIGRVGLVTRRSLQS
jgi:hypothetical protein